MASAVLLTYERKPGFSRNTSMKKAHNASNGYALDPVAPERSFTSETLADSSDARRLRPSVATAPCVAQNFTTNSAEPLSETASEDSCSLKRKSMSVNGDKVKDVFISDFGVSIKGLSRSEKSQLRKRLKVELQQVRSLSLKVEARELQVKGYSRMSAVHSHAFASSRSVINGSASNGHYVPAAAESSLRDGRPSRQPSLVIPEVNLESLNTAGKDKRTPKANQLYVNSEYLSGKEKLPPSEKQKSKTALSAKRSLHGKLDPRDAKRHKIDISYSRRISELLKQCGLILKKLMGHKFGWVFNEPVDVVKLNLHDYLKIIKRPMDLGTIKRKLDGGVYLLPTEFCEDVRLTFANAMKYNPQGHDVYHMADTLRGMFEGKWKTLEEKVKELDSANDRLADPDPKISLLTLPEQGLPVSNAGHVHSSSNRPVSAKKPKPASLARSASKPKSKAAPLPKRQMTFEEKQHLSDCLGSLPADKLEQAVQIMRKNPNLMQNEDEIEVDIESFDSETLWELHRFVVDCNRPKKQEERAVQAGLQGSSMPQMSNNGASKTPKPTQRGTEVGEEEVDIGDDMPAKEFPPVVIEKDRVVSMKNSSSSSSSSGSGSSSSDSDSGSSSGSDSEADDGHSAGAVSKVSTVDKEPVGSAAVGDRRGCPTLKDDGVKRSVNDVGEEIPCTKAVCPESGPQFEEGNDSAGEACHERQARAALLRSRFAETILKAQEKTLPLNKCDKVDLEKLKKDKEALERRRKEEKARLLAEGRAAELVRKKAELAAAAEAKQRREAEREAARLALQNMEKTVDIYEHMEVLKDLEKLRSAPEHIPCSGDDASPVHSSEGLSTFAFQGANPLERLGLFMRSDEEEEQQEVDPALAPCSSS